MTDLSSTGFTGLTVEVSQVHDISGTSRAVGRCRLSDPSDAASPDLGVPAYQTAVSVSPFGYDFVVHSVDVDGFILKPLSGSIDPNTLGAEVLIVDQSAMTNTYGTAAASCSVAGALFLIWSELTLSDGLGLQFFTWGGVPFVSGLPIVTGEDLGFSADQAANLTWLSFVAMVLPSGYVQVIGATWDFSISSGGLGDSDGMEMWSFVVNPAEAGGGPAAVAEKVSRLSADVPFMPSQITEGRVGNLSGWGTTTTYFCSGSTDALFFMYLSAFGSTLYDEFQRSPSAIGVWSSQDTTTWSRVMSPSLGVDSPVTASLFTPTDLGVSFDDAWQRLSLGVVDTSTYGLR